MNGSKKYLATFDEQKKEVKHELASLDNIFQHSETLLKIVEGLDAAK